MMTKSFRKISFFILLASSFGLANLVCAQDSERTQAAVAAMQVWLKGIDDGKYAESWPEAAASFQKAISQEKWVAALNAVRKPLGACTQRTLGSALQQSSVPSPTGEVKGDFVIAQFDTSFANLKYAVETVTFELQDGVWKASGYYIKPKA